MSKFIFVTGGVVSGLGKGITAASLGRLIKSRGYSVDIVKFDPYFNVDSMYISPYQHGEIFVTDDGSEGDLVLGHYERFLDQSLTCESDVTSGKIYLSVIERERRGEYNGKTVQVVPNITDEIKSHIYKFNREETDIVICEIGGVVGDIENNPYMEAVRQCRNELGRGNVLYLHVTYVPYIEMSGEQKTKPTQNSVKELQNIGIQPDIIVCRGDYPLGAGSKKKLSLFCNVPKECIIESITTTNLYNVPIQLENQHIAEAVLTKFKLEPREPDLARWAEIDDIAVHMNASEKKARVALVGKYTEKVTAYESLKNALEIASINNQVPVEIVYVQSDKLGRNTVRLQGYDGIVIAAGFGERGFEGKAAAATYARENNVPCLMIGLGAQAAVVEFARNVCGIEDADSFEFSPKTKNPVVTLVKEENFKRGGFVTNLTKGSALQKIYNAPIVRERHRHRYDFNAAYETTFAAKGLRYSAHSDDGTPEAFELEGHKFYVGVIYRPEFSSRPLAPHPLFDAFVKKCAK